VEKRGWDVDKGVREVGGEKIAGLEVREMGVTGCAKNTDRELWRESEDAYAPSVHVTEGGGIGIRVAGLVVVKTPTEWRRLYEESERLREYQRIAHRLWGMLDDVDTFDDMCKSNEEAYRSSVREKVKERFQCFTSDGYKLFLVTSDGVALEPEPEGVERDKVPA
jgi:hypothetical protein